MATNKEYLGDSVYIENQNDGSVVLTTENGLPRDPSNTIVLEREVIEALLNQLKHWNIIQ